MIGNLIEIGLSISVICNGYSLYTLIKALKENDRLDDEVLSLKFRVTQLEWQRCADIFIKSRITGDKDGSGIQGMAEDTKVAE